MSKIICDVCGTSYQESAAQCPICGCARPVDIAPQVANDDRRNSQRENYTYVKGGRFSKANVQKRHNGKLPDNHKNSTKSSAGSKSQNARGERGLVIAICALLLAIIAVAIYIAMYFFAGSDSNATDPYSTQAPTTLPVQTTAPTTEPDIPCTGIILSLSQVSLTAPGEECVLNAIITPADTTDELVFTTSDNTIATVSDEGKIVAIADGEAVITVVCGDFSAQCKVTCNFTTEPTVPATEPNTYVAPYKINKTDVSITVGETFLLKLSDARGEIIPVTWEAATADICSIDGNSVTGSAKGKVEVSATYEGETYTCIVRVR